MIGKPTVMFTPRLDSEHFYRAMALIIIHRHRDIESPMVIPMVGKERSFTKSCDLAGVGERGRPSLRRLRQASNGLPE
jgi:hypothetical protein